MTVLKIERINIDMLTLYKLLAGHEVRFEFENTDVKLSVDDTVKDKFSRTVQQTKSDERTTDEELKSIEEFLVFSKAPDDVMSALKNCKAKISVLQKKVE